MLKTEAVQLFLEGASSPLSRLYHPGMELQVQVSQGDGRLIKGTYANKNWKGYEDPVTKEMWKSFRIPWNAGTNPEYKDSNLNFNLDEHVEAIGLTGWNWEKRVSEYVTYDIDNISTHVGTGITEKELVEIEKKCSTVPWVSLYRSTSGNGLHLYLFFDKPVPAANHFEHAAISRSLLSVLSINVGVNFTDKVDCVGSVMWVWNIKQASEGLQPIKLGEKFPTDLIPKNWEEHISVTSGKRRRRKAISPEIETLFAAIKNMRLDDEHKRILKWFQEKSKYNWNWDTDYSMLVCHTLDLKTCHTDLKLKGLFDTKTRGSSDQNCFCFPMDRGGLVVRRFGKKVEEHTSWVKDTSGWTKTYFNVEPSFRQTMLYSGGLENEKGEFVFDTSAEASIAINKLGIDVPLDELPDNRVKLKKTDSRIIIHCDKDSKTDTKVKGFIKNTSNYEKIVHVEKDVLETDITLPDNLIRHVIANDSEAGWFLKVRNRWVQHTKGDILTALVPLMPNSKKREYDLFLGDAILDPWELVNFPFQTEYIGDRQWNKDSAQFAFEPTSGSCPTWEKVLNHLGTNMEDGIKDNHWCDKNGIQSGGEYLLYWIASMFQKPEEPLPYLFFFSEAQNTGKSTLGEALRMLFKDGKGCVKGDLALENKSGFNDELHGGVLVLVEETDLSNNAVAYNRIKNYVTGLTMSISTKFKSIFECTNTTHWIQTANSSGYCPIFPGDTRVSVTEVNELEEDIPKRILMGKLESEAPYFLYEILNIDLPKPEGRLGLPCITSDIKKMIEESNYTRIEQFMQDKCYYIEGAVTSIALFFNHFRLWLTKNAPKEEGDWSKNVVARKFPTSLRYPKGRHGSSNIIHIGNLSLDPNFIPEKKSKFIKRGIRIRRVT